MQSLVSGYEKNLFQNAGHNQQRGNRIPIAARRFTVIGQVLAHQPLIECPERGCYLPEGIRRTNDQPVSLPDRVQHLCQSVTANTVPLQRHQWPETYTAGVKILMNARAENIKGSKKTMQINIDEIATNFNTDIMRL